MKPRLPSPWVLTILSVAIVSLPASAQTKERFRGEGTITPTHINVGDCFDMADFSAAGSSSVLGDFEAVGRLRVDYCGIGPDIEGDITFTVANGDQLSMHFVGMRVDPTTYVARIAGTGGTGQYQNARVKGHLLIENYNLSDSFDMSFHGKIRLP